VNIYGANVDPYSPTSIAMFDRIRAGFMAAGADITTATDRAYAALFGTVQQQAAMASFVQLFRLLGIIFLLLLPLILLMRRPRAGAGPGPGAH
jgi:DHA2 family multidrug resistance protein